MFKLRQTWNDVFAAKKLYTLDIRVQCIDPAWPITAPAPTPSIHVNPKFFSKVKTHLKTLHIYGENVNLNYHIARHTGGTGSCNYSSQ